MLVTARSRFARATCTAIVVAMSAVLVACAGPQKMSGTSKKTRSKEYFAESEYGVKASPRVTNKRSNLPRGGGRDQIGKPYMVRGKMYYPKEERNYRRTGYASWYGSAFHGRLTANGEIYDMTHLTAAHPTMPLPSYARVTNIANGSSVIVRVNDRGPYSNGRIIDLSQKAAEMLDYQHHGTAKVKVEYVGRAPLEGSDDQYLLASYRPGKDLGPDPSDGLPSGVMIAMNGRTPSSTVGDASQVVAAAFPGTLSDADVPVPSDPMVTANVLPSADVELPSFAPIAPERPGNVPFGPADMTSLAMSYAPAPVRGTDAFAALDGAAGAGVMVTTPPAATAPYIAAATLTKRSAGVALAETLAAFGRTAIDEISVDGANRYSVSLYPAAGDLDRALEQAWSHGAPDAIAVRD